MTAPPPHVPPAHDEPAAAAARRRLLGATAVMASGTLVSRVLGFVRTMLVAFALGNATAQGDTFTLATFVPNSLYMIVAGGALNTVLVPQIVRHVRGDADGGEAFLDRIMTAFLLVLALVTALAWVFAPQVVGLWMGGAWHSDAMAAHRAALYGLTLLTMPQLFFYGAFFLVGQVLNARDRFGPMMWAPIANNVVQIVVLGAYAGAWAGQGDRSQPFTQAQVLVLGVGSTLGIVAQTLLLLPALRAAGVRFRPRFDLRGQGLGATFHLAKWAIGYVLLTQAASIVVTRLASSATVSDPARPGPGVLAYQEAQLTWLLPHSLLTVSLATALLPAASRLAAAGDLRGVGAETARTLRLAHAFIVPASVGLIVLAGPFAQLVFGNGAGASDWHAVAATLVCFAVGLVPYTIQYVYLRGFYALEDMRTAFRLQLWISAANVAVAVGWVWVDPDPATVAPRLALSYSASYLLGAAITFRALARRLPGLDAGAMLRHAAVVLAATLPGAALAVGLTWWADGHGRGPVAAAFVASVVLVLASYVALARSLRLDEVTEIVGLVGRRLLPRRGAAAPETVADDESDEASVIVAEELAAPDADTLRVYPEPDAAAPAGDADALAAPGDLLDHRYRLERRLHRAGGVQTWLARDEFLSRPVLVHLLPPDQPRLLDLLDEARDAAPTTDSRFLRVLDAVLAEGRPYGAYVVAEYAAGETLARALDDGPLSETEACWVAREVADGLVGVHAAGRRHGRVGPDTVLITTGGGVKVVGFPLDAVLAGPVPEGDAGLARDLRGLGDVLAACLGAGGATAAAVAGAGRRLRPGPASELAALLRGRADGDAAPPTAAAVRDALDDVLGGRHAAVPLDHRLRMSGPAAGEPDAPGDGADATAPLRDPFADTADAEDTDPAGPLTPPHPADERPFTPVPPPAPAAHDTVRLASPALEPRRPWQRALVVLFGLALVGGLVATALAQVTANRDAAAHRPLPVVSVRDFDPKADGGDDTENPALARLAVDGQASSAWRTERYGRSADFNGRKPGVGLLLDLGAPEDVASVRLTLDTGATGVQLRVPAGDAATATPSTATQADWRVVATAPAASGQVTLSPDAPVRARFVLVYLTRLPALGTGGYQASVAEITLSS